MPTSTEIKPAAIVEIERLAIKFTEVAQFDLSRLDPTRRVQVREPHHYAPMETVEQYAVMMGQSQFPPVVVTADDWLVDGNTRVGAALRRGNKFFPALVLDVAYAGASVKLKNELHALAATLNQQGGARLTPKEIREVAQPLIQLGWKMEEISRAIGLKPAVLRAVRKEIDAVAKLRRVGMESNGSMRGTSLRALGAQDVLTLNDVPYKELAILAGDAGFNAAEILATAREMKAVGSDQGALEHVNGLRAEFNDRIKEHKLTGVNKPPVSRQLRQHLGYVTKFAGKEQELIETDPKMSAMHIEALTTSISVLTGLLEMQK